jgi:hypothetical protein
MRPEITTSHSHETKHGNNAIQSHLSQQQNVPLLI